MTNFLYSPVLFRNNHANIFTQHLFIITNSERISHAGLNTKKVTNLCTKNDLI